MALKFMGCVVPPEARYLFLPGWNNAFNLLLSNFLAFQSLHRKAGKHVFCGAELVTSSDFTLHLATACPAKGTCVTCLSLLSLFSFLLLLCMSQGEGGYVPEETSGRAWAVFGTGPNWWWQRRESMKQKNWQRKPETMLKPWIFLDCLACS